MRSKLKAIIQIPVLLLLLPLSAGGVFYILLDVEFYGKIYPRVAIAGQNTNYLNPKEAQQITEGAIESWQNQKIQIKYNPEDPANFSLAKEWQIDPEELGIALSAPKTVLTAYNLGRTGNPVKLLSEKFKIITKGEDLPIYYDIDEAKFNSYIDNNFSFIEKPSKNASLAFIENKLIKTPAENGYKIDRNDLKNKLTDAVKNLKKEPISIKIITSFPAINDQAIEPVKNNITSLLDSMVFLKFEDRSWTLDKTLIRSAIAFPETNSSLEKENLGFSIKTDPIITYLEKIQMDINRKATDAVLGVKDDNLIVEDGGESGISLNVNASAEEISKAMLEGVKSNDKDIGVNLIVEETKATINKEKLDQMNITALLGQGKSNFSGSPKNRRYNIGVGAAKFNNIFIDDGKEFSFNEVLGDVDAKAGYLPELVIKEDKTVPEYGGGLCQVATTAFRAAIYSGLPITERRPHAYPVPYYNPQGLDATIYPPHPDLRFKNDTGGPILVQTKIVKNELYFNFFGVKQSRTIKIIGPTTYDQQPDGSLKAVFYREIYTDGKLFKKETFNSAYSSPSKYPHKNPLE